MNSKKGKYSQKLTIAAVGDISMGDHPVCVGHGMRSAFDKTGHQIIQDVKHHFQDADIVLGNLETVASDLGLNYFSLKSYEMRGRPDNLNYLHQAGFNVLGVANNHAMQHGSVAFEDTLNHLKALNISVIGTDSKDGKTQCVHFDVPNGASSIIFAVSMRPEEWTDTNVPYSLRNDENDLIEEVRGLRKVCKGFLICSIHWGLEFINLPGPEQINLGHRLIDEGVNIIFGHHPHVLQPVEEYNGGIIFYSLGNFIFDLWPLNMKYSVIVKVELERNKMPKYVCIPILIGNNFILRPAEEPHYSAIKNLLSSHRLLNQDFKHLSQSEYCQRYIQARQNFRFSSYKYFLKRVYKYPPHFLIQSLYRTALRRLLGN